MGTWKRLRTIVSVNWCKMLNGPLQNPKHEAFARNLAAGMGVHEAYKAAGYAGNATAATRLKNDPSVTIRVTKLNGEATAKAADAMVVSKMDIAKQLDEDRAFAKEKGSASAMVAATMGKAKLFGHLVDKQEHSGPNGKPIETREMTTLQGLSDAALEEIARAEARG